MSRVNLRSTGLGHKSLIILVCVLLATLLSPPGEEALNEYLKTKTVTLEY